MEHAGALRERIQEGREPASIPERADPCAGHPIEDDQENVRAACRDGARRNGGRDEYGGEGCERTHAGERRRGGEPRQSRRRPTRRRRLTARWIAVPACSGQTPHAARASLPAVQARFPPQEQVRRSAGLSHALQRLRVVETPYGGWHHARVEWRW